MRRPLVVELGHVQSGAQDTAAPAQATLFPRPGRARTRVGPRFAALEPVFLSRLVLRNRPKGGLGLRHLADAALCLDAAPPVGARLPVALPSKPERSADLSSFSSDRAPVRLGAASAVGQIRRRCRAPRAWRTSPPPSWARRFATRPRSRRSGLPPGSESPRCISGASAGGPASSSGSCSSTASCSSTTSRSHSGASRASRQGTWPRSSSEPGSCGG